MITFNAPWLLLLLIPLIAALVWSYPQVGGMAKGRKLFAFIVRSVLGALLILALAGPEGRQPEKGTATIFVLDQSDSISGNETERAKDFMRKALAKMGPDDSGGLIVFGQEAMVEVAPSGAPLFGRIDSKLNRSASDVAAAFRLAAASFPDGKARRIVLISDGNETVGDAIQAARTLNLDGVTLDTYSLGANANQTEVAILNREVPAQADQNQPINIRLVLDATKAGKGLVDLERNGQLISTTAIDFAAGTSSVLLTDRLSSPGFARYRATLRSATDTDSRNNLGVGFVAVKGAPKILVIQGEKVGPGLTNAFRANGLEVEEITPSAFPTRPELLQPYEAVIFNDVPAQNFSEGQMKLLQAAVRDTGIGFAMVGGEGSFLPGGYYGTPVAEILPVDLNIRQRKTFPSTSVLVVVDCSGSMGMIEDGVQKLRMAAKAAEETVKLLAPRDRIGVMGSSDGLEMKVPFQEAGDRTAVIQGIRKLEVTGGGIYIGPSVEKADGLLRAEKSKVRHMILLADGGDSTDWRDAIQRVSKLRADKITTTVIAIGQGKDVPMLQQLARVGGGRFYLATRAAQLPAIFTQDAAIISRSAIEEGEFLPKLTGNDPALRGITATPTLLAYCLSDSRPLARVSLRTHKDDPLFASWQYGLGRSAAFTSDAQPRWARNWVGWEGYGAFWSQLARSIGRQLLDQKFDIRTSSEGAKGLVEVNALPGASLASGAKVRVSTPEGGSQEVTLAQVGPTQFRGTFDATESGTYLVTLGEATTGLQTAGFSQAYPPEYRNLRTNTPFLSEIARVGAGAEVTDPASVFRRPTGTSGSIQDLWMFFVLAAALLLPFDVGIRRLAIPLWKILSEGLGKRKALATQEVTKRSEVVQRLKIAKQRVPVQEPVKLETIDLPPPPDTPRPVTPVKSNDATANTLIELKRKKKGQDDPEAKG